MRIVRFVDQNGQVCDGQEIGQDTARLIAGDILGKYRVTDETARITRRLAPINPPNIFCIGLNYRAHAAESGLEIPRAPVVFGKPTTTLIGPGDPIVLPASAPEEVDYEAELAMVIGKRAKNVPEERALDFVLGYTCANDVSARDCQIRLDKQWARAKGFDTFCPLGPCLVTPDEIDGDHLAIRAVLNGKTVQDSTTADMIFSCRTLVSYLSHQFTLLPGTVICTGTPQGVGCARKPPLYLRRGDAIRIEIEGIGQLNNPVALEG
jgi:2-keto-4-pentenoate hydratase/2-oxohepta-3-ene-1,7-dioic acid hydratase in catechol pathway